MPYLSCQIFKAYFKERIIMENIEELRALWKRIIVQQGWSEDWTLDESPLLKLMEAAQANAQGELDRAFMVLDIYGVPKERARNVSNGIEVLVNRYDKQLQDMKH